MVSSSVDQMNSSQQAHRESCRLMEGSQQAHSVSSSCKFTEVDECLLNELAMSFHVSSGCVSCELKFFTGYPPPTNLAEIVTFLLAF